MRKDKTHTIKRLKQVSISIFVALIVIAIFIYATHGRNIPVLDPHGLIADQERDLILLTLGLGLFIVIPVFIMLFSIAWRYRASNTKARYEPDFGSSKLIEAIWWGIPCVIIIVLAIITAIYTHLLDPYKPIESNVRPITIQVVSLDWKWLFIYPDQKIATVNYFNIPEKTPINFTITSDAPMNSFWIPALAGQVYSMSGMSTQLHIMADSVGTYTGSSANISGDGFADMQFKVNSMNQSDYQSWLQKSARSSSVLTQSSYDTLSKPSHDTKQVTYALSDQSLYNTIVMKYMSSMSSDSSNSGMNMSSDGSGTTNKTSGSSSTMKMDSGSSNSMDMNMNMSGGSM